MNPKREALPRDLIEDLGLRTFHKKIPLGFFIKQCPMVVAKRGAETSVHRSGIVCALEPWQMFRGKVV